MPQKMYLINDPEFSEYVYFVMSTTPQEVLMKLNAKELSYFKDKLVMRRFADNETFEKRLLLLAKLEVPFCLVVGKRKPVDQVLEEIYTQYQYVEKRKALTQAMAREKVFVMSSNEVLIGLHMAAQNSHSSVYVLNYDYVKMHSQLTKETVNKHVKAARESFDILSRACLITTQKIGSCDIIVGVSTLELRILLAMYPFKNTFVSAHKLYEILDEDERKKGIVKTATEMEKIGYLKVLPGFNEQRNRLKTYTIAEKGIDVVCKWLSYVSDYALYGINK